MPRRLRKPPKPAVPEKFYDEIPVKVQLNGSFLSTVSFFAKIAKLSRIVNVEEIAMGDAQDVKGAGMDHQDVLYRKDLHVCG